MKKDAVLILILILSAVQSVSAGERLKVAVLDATIGNGVEVNASAIVADTINEQFVKSDGYIAIDRAYISKIQAEKKFQLSGEVNSEDVKELGAIFGAQFICIANVSKLGSTYTVSARMIDVATAQVVSQESARQKGQIDILFEVAETVGGKLVGKNYSASKPVPAPLPEEKKVVQEKAPEPIKKPVKTAPRKRLTIGYMMTGYLGNDTEGYYPIYDRDLYLEESTYLTDIKSPSYGIDLELLMPKNNFYISAGLNYTDQSINATDNYNYYEGDYFSWDNFYTFEIYFGAGGIFKSSNNVQFFAGVNIGYLLLTYGSDYGGDATGSTWGTAADETAGGLTYGIEIGLDYFIGIFNISIKYKLAYSGALVGDNVFTEAMADEGFDNSFGTSGLVLSFGLPW